MAAATAAGGRAEPLGLALGEPERRGVVAAIQLRRPRPPSRRRTRRRPRPACDPGAPARARAGARPRRCRPGPRSRCIGVSPRSTKTGRPETDQPDRAVAQPAVGARRARHDLRGVLQARHRQRDLLRLAVAHRPAHDDLGRQRAALDRNADQRCARRRRVGGDLRGRLDLARRRPAAGGEQHDGDQARRRPSVRCLELDRAHSCRHDGTCHTGKMRER